MLSIVATNVEFYSISQRIVFKRVKLQSSAISELFSSAFANSFPLS